jgi:hypothetical protein
MHLQLCPVKLHCAIPCRWCTQLGYIAQDRPTRVWARLNRHDQRRATRRETWCHQPTAERNFRAAYERMAADTKRTAERDRELDADSLELRDHVSK